MGNDGGSIPTRRELVKEAARNPSASELKESLTEKQEYYWNTDPLTQRPLAQPVVSDHLGRLFNKDSVIEFLLPADDGDDNASKRSEQQDFLQGTIKSLKDVVEVKFEIDDDNAAVNGNTKHRQNAITRPERWVCPITKQELGPAAKAVYVVPCGHAFSGAAIKEISEERCLQCNEPYAANDLIPILPTSETEIARLTLRAKTLKDSGLAHSLKKVSGSNKKRKKNGVETALETSNGHTQTTDPTDPTAPKVVSKSSTPQPPAGPAKASNGIKNAATASLTAKVLEEQEERNKRRKMDKNENLDSLFSHSKSVDDSQRANRTDFMNRGYAIPSRR